MKLNEADKFIGKSVVVKGKIIKKYMRTRANPRQHGYGCRQAWTYNTWFYLVIANKSGTLKLRLAWTNHLGGEVIPGQELIVGDMIEASGTIERKAGEARLDIYYEGIQKIEENE